MARCCASCGRNFFKGSFSNNQWSKGVGISRCYACVQGTKGGGGISSLTRLLIKRLVEIMLPRRRLLMPHLQIPLQRVDFVGLQKVCIQQVVGQDSPVSVSGSKLDMSLKPASLIWI
jgi:hypothetical protein